MKDKIIKIGLVCLGSLSVLISYFANAGLTEPVLLQTYTTKQSDQSYTNNNYELLCIENDSCSNYGLIFNWDHAMSAYYVDSYYDLEMACGVSNIIYFTSLSNCTFRIYGINTTNYTKQECKSTYSLIESSDCPTMTSLQCQTNYSLIPISSVDSNYCQNNNLCPDSGNNGFSNLYINDIFHPGAFNIFINIPEEIDWDYAYTSSGLNFNLDVVGYNQDTEYITSWIDTNNYKPTTDDFAHIFGGFANFGGLLIATLFIILVFYFVKKSFR